MRRRPSWPAEPRTTQGVPAPTGSLPGAGVHWSLAGESGDPGLTALRRGAARSSSACLLTPERRQHLVLVRPRLGHARRRRRDVLIGVPRLGHPRLAPSQPCRTSRLECAVLY
jgi:hypothetical protein